MRTRATASIAVTSIAATLLIAPAPASAAFAHVVAPGESLTSVARTDGLSVVALAAANGLSSEAELIAGQTLLIPPRGEGIPEPAEGAGSSVGDTEPPAGEASPGAAPEAGAYVVQPGDTLTAIAALDGTSVEALARMNEVNPEGVLLSGSVLRLPVASSEAAAVAEGQPAPAAEGSEPFPTEETVSPTEVGTIAAEHGVPPTLAEAIAEQESGFNNGLTSTADARGVMQILPETWSWIGHNLAGPEGLEPASAVGNIRGGVLLLQWLLGETEGDPASAAAGYFQGLESVRERGDYPETEQYVGDVLALQNRFAAE